MSDDPGAADAAGGRCPRRRERARRDGARDRGLDPADVLGRRRRGAYLQLDDAVIVDTEVPGAASCASPGSCRTCGPATRARSSTPTCSWWTGACCRSTRPSRRRWSRRGSSRRSSCRRCRGCRRCVRAGRDRDQALYFDPMERRLPGGLIARRRADVPGPGLPRRDARRARQHLRHLRASPRRRRTRCSCCTRCSTPTCSAAVRANTKAIVFNVKGEDLMWLDTPNAQAVRAGPGRVRAARAAGRAVRVGGAVGAGPRRTPAGRRCRRWRAARRASPPTTGPSASSSASGCCGSCSPRRDDERSQIADLVARVESYLDRECEDDPDHDATVAFGGYPVRDFEHLCEVIRSERRGRGLATGAGGSPTRPSRRSSGGWTRRGSACGPPDLGTRGRGPGRAPHRLGGQPGHGRRHPQPARPGQAVRHRRRDQAAVRGQGAHGPARAARVPGPGRAEPLRAARRMEPDQGGAAGRRRARPFARHDPDRRRADGERGRAPRHRELARSASSGGWTPPRRSAASTASCRRSRAPARHPEARVDDPAAAAHPHRRCRSGSPSPRGRRAPTRPRLPRRRPRCSTRSRGSSAAPAHGGLARRQDDPRALAARRVRRRAATRWSGSPRARASTRCWSPATSTTSCSASPEADRLVLRDAACGSTESGSRS